MNSHLSDLFTHLNSSGISYCLITDFEGDFSSSDIDLFVLPADRQMFEKLLFDHGWYRRQEPAHHINHHFYYKPGAHPYLDVKYALSFAGGHSQCFTYRYADEVVSTAVLNSKGVYRPQGTHAILLYAAHLAYKERGKLEVKHATYLGTYLKKYRSETAGASVKTMAALAAWLTQSFPHGLAELRQLISPYFRPELKKMVRKETLKYGLGFKVLFLGTDGAGKTTLIEEVKKSFNMKTSNLYLGTGENGWTNSLIKSLYNFKARSKLLKRLFGILKVYVVLPLEFSMRIIPVKLKSKYRITLIDRFPGRVFLEKRPIRTALYRLLLPKPDIVFFLYANPEDLVKRKPNEVSLESSQADILKFRRVAQVLSDGKYREVNTSDLSITEALDYITKEIYKHPKVFDKLLTSNLQEV